MFQCAYDAHNQFTRLFDFVAPTAISLWNLRWQVQGFLKATPEATSQDLSNRFAFGSGMRGGELKRACVEISWNDQLEQFANFVLINAIAGFEDFTARLAEIAASDADLQRRISNGLQFPGGSSQIPGAPTRDFAYSYLTVSSSHLTGVFARDPRSLRRYAGGKLDNLLLCYRFFKSLRNAIAHNGGRIDTEVLNNYARYSPVANATALGLKEAPVHPPIKNIDDPIHLDLRGVTGLTNVILHVVTTYDIDFGESMIAEKEVATRIRATSKPNAKMFAGRSGKRNQQILARVQSANLPNAVLTSAFEAYLKAEKIIPGYV